MTNMEVTETMKILMTTLMMIMMMMMMMTVTTTMNMKIIRSKVSKRIVLSLQLSSL